MRQMLITANYSLTICHTYFIKQSKKQCFTPQIKIKEIYFPNFNAIFF